MNEIFELERMPKGLSKKKQAEFWQKRAFLYDMTAYLLSDYFAMCLDENCNKCSKTKTEIQYCVWVRFTKKAQKKLEK